MCGYYRHEFRYAFVNLFISLVMLIEIIIKYHKNSNIICLFVYLGFFVPLENFSLIWRRHHCYWKAENFYLCSALMAIKQLGFFSVPHLLWHGASVYNSHLRRPVTLTPVAECLAVELSPTVLRLGSVAARIRNPNNAFARRTI